MIKLKNVLKGKLTEAKKYTLGDKYSNDFDYTGMLQIGAKAKVTMGLKKLNQLYDSFTDVNYHTEGGDLGNAIDWLQDEGPDHPKVKQFMKMFNKACLKTLRGLKEGKLTEHTVNFTKGDMDLLHKNGKVVKADPEGKEHTYTYTEPTNPQPQDESKLTEGRLSHDDAYDILDIAAMYTSTAHSAASQQWWDAQDLYDYIKSDHIKTNRDKKAFYKAIKREFPSVTESKMIKLKDVLNEVNKSDVNYAMKMAFDSVPGNWHKALKKVDIQGNKIKLNMSSYMGPGKVLQKIVDQFNTSMGTKFKIDKNSFQKGSVTSIELQEGKINEANWPSSVNDSKVESLRRELDKMEEKLRVMVTKYDKAKDNKKTIHDFHKQVERKRKEYNSSVLYKMMSILNEGKITEAKDQKLAKLFQASKSANVKMGEDKLYKLSQEWERWNVDNDDKYDDLVDPLFAAVELVQDAGTIKNSEYHMHIRSAKKHLDKFNKDVVKAMRLHKHFGTSQ